MKLQVIRLKHKVVYHPEGKDAKAYSRVFTEGMVFDGPASALKAFPERLRQVSEDTPITDLDSVPINGNGGATAQAADVVKGHEVTDLNKLSAAQLQEYAEDREIDLTGLNKKADIIAAIQLATGEKKVA
jgi:hypothetical protein